MDELTGSRRRKYAYSIKTTRVREQRFPYNGKKLTCREETLMFLRALEEADNENMVVIMLNTQNYLIGVYITEGSVDQAAVYPRDIARQSLLMNASALILAHNHPSGDITPSPQDIEVTKRIVEAVKLFSIKVHDHMIIGAEGKFFSFRDEFLI